MIVTRITTTDSGESKIVNALEDSSAAAVETDVSNNDNHNNVTMGYGDPSSSGTSATPSVITGDVREDPEEAALGLHLSNSVNGTKVSKP